MPTDLPPDAPLRLAVFASGGGTNFEAIAQAISDGSLPAQLVLCLTNRSDAGVLNRAERRGIPTAILPPTEFTGDAAFTDAMLEELRRYDVSFIALAGYMLKVPSAIVKTYRHRMLNIHPALLPAFGGKGMYGRRVHEAVLEYGVRWTGVTVHLVDEDYDTGPVVLQHPVPVQQDDTPESLARRVLRFEHALYPAALRLFAEGRVHVEGRTVKIDGDPHPDFS